MSNGSDAGETRLDISGRVFAFAAVVLVVVALVVGAAGLLLGLSAIHGERDAGAQLLDAQQNLGAAHLELARCDGRVSTFEALLISTNHTALEASLRAFERERGAAASQATLAEYAQWISRK